MNYDVFLKLENNTLIKSDEETEQRFMERIFRERSLLGRRNESTLCSDRGFEAAMLHSVRWLLPLQWSHGC